MKEVVVSHFQRSCVCSAIKWENFCAAKRGYSTPKLTNASGFTNQMTHLANQVTNFLAQSG